MLWHATDLKYLA